VRNLNLCWVTRARRQNTGKEECTERQACETKGADFDRETMPLSAVHLSERSPESSKKGYKSAIQYLGEKQPLRNAGA